MVDEATPEEKQAVRERYAFEAAVDQATRGKPAELAKLLRADLPLTAEHKAQLADLVEGKHKRKQGRQKAYMFSKAWWVAKIVKSVRDMCAQSRGLTHGAALELLILLQAKGIKK